MPVQRHEPRSASTRFLRIPAVDWPAVAQGEKRQVRLLPHGAPRFHAHLLPSPVVGYSRGSIDIRSAAMLVVESFKVEPLLAISAPDLRAEGFDDIDEYRRYWNAHRGGFKPMTRVHAYTIRPFEPSECDDFARSIFHHLYGPWLREALVTTS